MGHEDLEMTGKPPSSDKEDSDKAIAQRRDGGADEDRPPTPPRRDPKRAEHKAAPPPTVSEPRPRSKIGSFPRPEFISKPETSTQGCMSCLRTSIILFNVLLFVFGAALTGIGATLKLDRNFLEIQTQLDLKEFTSAAYVLIAAGVFIMIIGLVGCYGAYAQSICMLITYSIVIVIIIILEIAVMGLVFSVVRDKDLGEKIKEKAKKAIQEMSKSEAARQFLDLIQTELKCCGIDGPKDYNGQKIPNSCTNPGTGQPFEQGCLNPIINYLKGKASILGGVAIAVFIMQLAVLILTCCLASVIRNAKTAVF